MHDPVIRRIYGKLNLDREYLTSEVRKVKPKRFKSQPAKLDKDEHLLRLINRDFDRSSKKLHPHYDYNTADRIKQSIHEQVMSSDVNSVIV